MPRWAGGRTECLSVLLLLVAGAERRAVESSAEGWARGGTSAPTGRRSSTLTLKQRDTNKIHHKRYRTLSKIIS